MILADAKFNEDDNGAQCLCKISGNAEVIAIEYATITKALIEEGGQAILDRAMDIMKKEINEHEEKRSK